MVGHRVSMDLEVAHTGLRSLIRKEYDECSLVVLDCPFLEDLKIASREFDASWDEIVDSSCPRLKKVHLVWDMEHVNYEEDDGPFDFYDETVEELVLECLVGQDVAIEFQKLERLVMTWAPLTEAPLSFPAIECVDLTSIELDGYLFILPNIPSLLSALPILEVLRLLCCRESVKEVVLEHERVRDVDIGNSETTMDHVCLVKDRVIIVDEFELTLMMPSLLRVDVEKSSVRVLKLVARDRGIVKYVTAENGCKVIEMGPEQQSVVTR